METKVTMGTACATTALLAATIFDDRAVTFWKANPTVRDSLDGHAGLFEFIAEMAQYLEDTVAKAEERLTSHPGTVWEELDWYRTGEAVGDVLAEAFRTHEGLTFEHKPSSIIKGALRNRIDDVSEGEDEYTDALDALQSVLLGGDLVPDEEFSSGQLTLGYRKQVDGHVGPARELEEGFWAIYRRDEDGHAEWLADFQNRNDAVVLINAVREIGR